MLKKPKGPPFTFFGTMRLLTILLFRFLEIFKKFSKFFNVSELFIFLIFCNKLDFQKAQRVHPSTISKTLRFLSLGYGADFRRSRLVSLFFKPVEVTIFMHLSTGYFPNCATFVFISKKINFPKSTPLVL